MTAQCISYLSRCLHIDRGFFALRTCRSTVKAILLWRLDSLQAHPYGSRMRKKGEKIPRDDRVALVMRGYCVTWQLGSGECPAGTHCPFARGPGCSNTGDSSSSSSRSKAHAACPVGDACVRQEWLYTPPSRVFDVRFTGHLCEMTTSECFDLVHAPHDEDLVDFQPCSNVLLQGDARCFLFGCQAGLQFSACT